MAAPESQGEVEAMKDMLSNGAKLLATTVDDKRRRYNGLLMSLKRRTSGQDNAVVHQSLHCFLDLVL